MHIKTSNDSHINGEVSAPVAMAPPMLDDVYVHLRAIISTLYMLMVQAHEYQGTSTQQAINAEIKRLIQELLALTQSAKDLPTHVPFDLVEKFIEQGRNPDIYTRDLVEEVMKYNQQLEGQSQAFASFRDILAQQMASAVPEMRDDVKKVVEASGGRLE